MSYENTSSTALSPVNQNDEFLYSPQQYWMFLQIYICLAITANFGLLFWDSNGADTGFWTDWIKQLAVNGYHNFNGNYPPVYVHWLYLVGQIYNLLQLPIENNLFLKFLTQFPIHLAHIFLVIIVYELLKRYAVYKWHFHGALVLTVLNPAIYFNGPIWGQVDLLPVIPVILAVLISAHKKYKVLAIPFYLLALLTKFQMIAFAPVMGLLFLRDIKVHLMGFLASLLLVVVLFAPFIFANNFLKAFSLSYLDVLHQYSATTMGAANIWILLTGNAAPDSIILFGISAESPLAWIFRAKMFGIISFCLIVVCVFAHGVFHIFWKKNITANRLVVNQLLVYALICTVAFFTLLPAMHERYLLPGVIISLVIFALNSKKWIYPVLLSLISFFNLAMCLGLKTSSVWPSLSWIMLFVFVFILLDLYGNLVVKARCRIWLGKIFETRYFALAFFAIALSYMSGRLYFETILIKPSLENNQKFLTDFPHRLIQQDYGKLAINRSVGGNNLRAGNRRFAVGLGTHANSIIEYTLPVGVKSLSIGAGLDDETESASVIFSVWSDNVKLWESRSHYGAEDPEFTTIQLNGVSVLRLKVDGKGNISGDHADWLLPILTFELEL